MLVLEIKSLTVEVKGKLLLREINLGVREGEIISVIGNNGAGKTTLLKTISGFFKPTMGEIFFKGEKITRLSPHEVAKLGIAHVPEGRRIFTMETVKDNLLLGAYTRWWREKKQIIKESENFINKYPIVGKHYARIAGTLSGGEQQFLAILRGLMMSPVVLMLDEPSLGLAPLAVKEIFKLIEDCKKTFNLSIILVEQMAKKALSICDRAYILERGAIVAEGTGKEFLVDPIIKKTYLGSL